MGLEQTEEGRGLLARRLEVAQRAGDVGLWDWDPQTGAILWDARMFALFDLDPATPIDLDRFLALVDPRDRPRLLGELRAAASGAARLSSDFRILTSGIERWVCAAADLVPRPGRAPRLVGACRDITASRGFADQLHEGREQLEITLASISDGVVTVDGEGRIAFLNAAAESLMGVKAPAVAGRPAREVLDLRTLDGARRLPDVVGPCLRAGTVGSRVQARLLDQEGRTYEVEITCSCIRTRHGDVVGAIAVLRDLTEAKQLERELRYAATHDALTGLPNRKQLEEALEAAVADSRRGGGRHVLGYLDIDQFKIINDSAGHAAGDLFLRQIAEAFLRVLKPRDLLARMGGDEFALILSDKDLDSAIRLCERLLEVAADFRFAWEDRVYASGVSIGLCAIVADADPAELLSQADIACYMAKSGGRGRLAVYRPDEISAPKRRQEINLVAGLREALDEGRLILHAQEVAPAPPGSPMGRRFELLVRMVARDGTLIQPDAFIPAAERFDLMADIDRWVVSEALDRLGARIAALPDLKLAINLSGNTLNSPGAMDAIVKTIVRSPIEAEALTFELTETAVLNHLAAASAFMDRLRSVGCRIALDDFGAGLSSFSYLKRFPVDLVKIDGGFIRNIVASEVDRAIVESMNALAHRLGAETAAEFVENEAIIAVVRAIGVDYLQGYAIGRPLPFAAVLNHLDAIR